MGLIPWDRPPILHESLKIEQRRIPIAGLPTHLSPSLIAQLSDFHYDGVRVSETLLQNAIAAANEAQPDLIVLTGDFITYEPEPIYPLVERLRQLQSRCGVVAILGNHDSYCHGAKTTIVSALEQAGITVLWNSVVYPFGPELAIAGLADMWSGDFHPDIVLDHLDPTLPRVVLSHNPDSAVPLQRWRVDLQLSGHTHGGQIVLPNGAALPHVLLRLRRCFPRAIARHLWRECTKIIHHWEWSEGYHRVGNNQLYVNRGLGSYFPGRWNCPPELTLITLETADVVR